MSSQPHTILGSLTTAFQPPSACQGIWGDVYSSTDIAARWGVTCDINNRKSGLRPVQDGPNCYPPGLISYSSDLDNNQPGVTLPLYSPGLVCPSGWSAACTVRRGNGAPTPNIATVTGDFLPYLDDSKFWSILQDGETLVGCCPRYEVWLTATISLAITAQPQT